MNISFLRIPSILMRKINVLFIQVSQPRENHGVAYARDKAQSRNKPERKQSNKTPPNEETNQLWIYPIHKWKGKAKEKFFHDD